MIREERIEHAGGLNERICAVCQGLLRCLQEEAGQVIPFQNRARIIGTPCDIMEVDASKGVDFALISSEINHTFRTTISS